MYKEPMLIDLTLRITPKMVADAQGNEKRALVGHLGTHFDVMNKVFPLEYTQRNGIVFHVPAADRDVGLEDVDLDAVEPGMFVAFHTGFIEREPYGSPSYFHAHPQLSRELIDALLERQVSIIGIDCAGIRRGKEHPIIDQICADRGVFVVENLCNLGAIEGTCIVNTYPMNYEGVTGLPCRVVAEVFK